MCRSIISTTPLDLIDDGLYNDLAIPLMRGKHREVSVALLAKRLGARQRSRKSLVVSSMRQMHVPVHINSESVASVVLPPQKSFTLCGQHGKDCARRSELSGTHSTLELEA